MNSSSHLCCSSCSNSTGNSVRGVYDSSRVETDGYYDVYSAAPGWLNSWKQINSRRTWLAGGFLWTGFDYVGEVSMCLCAVALDASHLFACLNALLLRLEC